MYSKAMNFLKNLSLIPRAKVSKDTIFKENACFPAPIYAILLDCHTIYRLTIGKIS